MSKSPLEIMQMLSEIAKNAGSIEDLPPEIRAIVERAQATGKIKTMTVNQEQMDEMTNNNPALAEMLKLSSVGVVESRLTSHLAPRYAFKIEHRELSDADKRELNDVLSVDSEDLDSLIPKLSERSLAMLINSLTHIDDLVRDMADSDSDEREKTVVMNVLAGLQAIGFDNALDALRQGYPRLLWYGFQGGAIEILDNFITTLIQRVGVHYGNDEVFNRVMADLTAVPPLDGPELTPLETFDQNLDSVFARHHVGDEIINTLLAAGYKTLPALFKAGHPVDVLTNAGLTMDQGREFMDGLGHMQGVTGESEVEFRTMMREISQEPAVMSFIMENTGIANSPTMARISKLLKKINVEPNEFLSWLPGGHDKVIAELSKRITDPVELVDCSNQVLATVKDLTNELIKFKNERAKSSKSADFRKPEAMPNSVKSDIRRASSKSYPREEDKPVLVSDPVVRTALGPVITKLATEHNITDLGALVHDTNPNADTLTFTRKLSKQDRNIIGDLVRFRITLDREDGCDCEVCVENRQFRLDYLKEHPDVAEVMGLDVDDNPYGRTLH